MPTEADEDPLESLVGGGLEVEQGQFVISAVLSLMSNSLKQSRGTIQLKEEKKEQTCIFIENLLSNKKQAQNSVLNIVMETSEKHLSSSLHWTAGGMRPLCLETYAPMLQQAFCSKGMSSPFPSPSPSFRRYEM